MYDQAVFILLRLAKFEYFTVFIEFSSDYVGMASGCDSTQLCFGLTFLLDPVTPWFF